MIPLTESNVKEILENFSLEAEKFKIIVSGDSAILWIPSKNKYIVQTRKGQIDYELIHEFGHVVLAKVTQYPIFAKFSAEVHKMNQKMIELYKETSKTDFASLPANLQEYRKINDCCNGILDSFVNYYTFIEDKRYYSFYLKYLEKVIKSKRTLLSRINTRKFRMYKTEMLPVYLYFYLEFNYNLPTSDKNILDMTDFLDNVRNSLIKSDYFSTIEFDFVDQELDKYVKVRKSKDHKTIIDFIYNVLLTFPFWEEDALQQSLAIIYPVQ